MCKECVVVVAVVVVVEDQVYQITPDLVLEEEEEEEDSLLEKPDQDQQGDNNWTGVLCVRCNNCSTHYIQPLDNDHFMWAVLMVSLEDVLVPVYLFINEW